MVDVKKIQKIQQQIQNAQRLVAEAQERLQKLLQEGYGV